MRLPGPRLLLAASALCFAAFAIGVLVLARTRAPAPPTTASTSTPPQPQPLHVRADAFSAVVTWRTAALSNPVVAWAPTGMVPQLWAREAAPATAHEVRITGLAPNTRYTATVGGRSVDFETPAIPASPAAGVTDGVVHVDGRPFFPVIAWHECPDRWPQDLRAGINLFGGNPCTGLPNLAAAVAGRALVAGTADDAPEDAAAGLVGWFYPDEADARGLTGATLRPPPSGLRFLTLTSHFFDDAAPLPSGREMYPALIAKADVVGFDLYPLQELCRPALLPWVFDAQRALRQEAYPRATFQWIEARELRCPQRDAAVTPATIRVESWLAIAGGATAIAFFPPNLEPAAAAAIRGVTGRIRQLAPALLQPPLAVDVPAVARDVRASARRYGGAVYLIAVNAGRSQARVRLASPELGDRTFAGAGRASGGVLAVDLPMRSARVFVSRPQGG